PLFRRYCLCGLRGSMGHNQSVHVSQGVDNRSLHCQIVALGAAGVLLTTAATCWVVLPDASDEMIRRLVLALVLAGAVGLMLLAMGAARLLRPLRSLRDDLKRSVEEHEASKQVLSQRTRTVDRLLEFSQTVQGVGKADQIFATLAHFLRVELNLAGIVVIASD